MPAGTETVPSIAQDTTATQAAEAPTELTESAKEVIDIASIEASANAYAASLGYIIDPFDKFQLTAAYKLISRNLLLFWSRLIVVVMIILSSTPHKRC